MTVDLSKLKVNDVIDLRDGSLHVVKEILGREGYGGDVVTTTERTYNGESTSCRWFHTSEGSVGFGTMPGDIVRILPAAEDTVLLYSQATGEVTEVKGGVKHDGDKPALALLPFRATEEVAKVLAFGAKKYGTYNYKAGFAYTRLISAALRHVFAFARGHDKDEETGLSHLAHAACCVLFLLDQQLAGTGEDDRWKEDKAG